MASSVLPSRQIRSLCFSPVIVHQCGDCRRRMGVFASAVMKKRGGILNERMCVIMVGACVQVPTPSPRQSVIVTSFVDYQTSDCVPNQFPNAVVPHRSGSELAPVAACSVPQSTRRMADGVFPASPFPRLFRIGRLGTIQLRPRKNEGEDNSRELALPSSLLPFPSCFPSTAPSRFYHHDLRGSDPEYAFATA